MKQQEGRWNEGDSVDDEEEEEEGGDGGGKEKKRKNTGEEDRVMANNGHRGMPVNVAAARVRGWAPSSIRPAAHGLSPV